MTELVVDTNVMLFFLQGHFRLPRRAARLIEDASRCTVVSMASLWEIAIKVGLGKLTFDFADDPNSSGLLRDRGLDVQPISWQVMRRAAALP